MKDPLDNQNQKMRRRFKTLERLAAEPPEKRLPERILDELSAGLEELQNTAALKLRQQKEASGRSQAGNALGESDPTYRAIFDSVNDAIFVHDARTGKLIDVNEKVFHLYAYAKEDLKGFDVGRLSAGYPPYRAKEAGEWLRKAAQDGPQVFEWLARRKDGETFWVEVNLKRATIKGKKVVLAVVRDLTERKRAEEALRLSEERLKLAIEGSGVGLWDWRVQTGQTIFNDRWAQILGYTLQELAPISIDTWKKFVHPDDLRQSNELIQRHFAGETEDYECEVRMKHKDGRWVWVLDRGRVVERDQEGKPVRMAGTHLDITPRKKAEEALRTAHQQLFDIIEFLPDATFVIDREKKVIAWNRAIEEMTQVKKEDIIGKGDYAYSVPFYGEPRKIMIDLTLEPESGEAKKYDSIEKRGNTLHAEVFVPTTYGGKGAYLYGTASPLYDPAGNLIGAIESIRDITERKKAEEALQKSRDQLRYLSTQLLESQELERRRIAREMHDGIGQILTAIKFKVERTLSRKDKNGGKEPYKILESVTPMIQEIIEEVRKIQTDLRPSVLDDLGIVTTISWFCQRYRDTYPSIRVEQEVDIQEEEIPDSLKTVIYRILQESMNNIAKHSQGDYVHVLLRKKGGLIELSTKDNGRGFDLEEALSAVNPNRGLGLSSMRERAQISGGMFEIDSRPGSGTVIRAYWPASRTNHEV